MTATLITNDDGFDSPGLHRLAAVAVSLGLDVTIAAPAGQSSGASASIIGAEADGRVKFERRRLSGFDDVDAFAVKAAPGLISLLAAHGAFGPAPELVLSGVNRGANLGRAILHSGTVGAALTGAVNGARALAVSLDVGMNPTATHWHAVDPFVQRLVPLLLALPTGTAFNLNVPNVETDVELREAPLASFGIVQTTMTLNDEREVRLSVADAAGDHEPGTDAALLQAGFATVTSITSIADTSMSPLALHDKAG